MTSFMYSACVPVGQRMLKNLSAILAKAEAHCEARKIEPSAFLNARIFPDMFPLTRQVQIATDMIKGAACRLSGTEIPRFEDTETTFADLQARLAKTVALLETVKPEQFEGSETRDIVLALRGRELKFKGQDYLNGYALPNFYFHVTTAYNLLRHGGVEIGKGDFLGG